MEEEVSKKGGRWERSGANAAVFVCQWRGSSRWRSLGEGLAFGVDLGAFLQVLGAMTATNWFRSALFVALHSLHSSSPGFAT